MTVRLLNQSNGVFLVFEPLPKKCVKVTSLPSIPLIGNTKYGVVSFVIDNNIPGTYPSDLVDLKLINKDKYELPKGSLSKFCKFEFLITTSEFVIHYFLSITFFLAQLSFCNLYPLILLNHAR